MHRTALLLAGSLVCLPMTALGSGPERVAEIVRAGAVGEGIEVGVWHLDLEVDAPLGHLEKEVRNLLGERVTLLEVARRESLTLTAIYFQQLIDGVEVEGGDGVIRLDRVGALKGLSLSLARPVVPAEALIRVKGVSVPDEVIDEERVWYNARGRAVPAIRVATGTDLRTIHRVFVDGTEVATRQSYYEKEARVFEANPVTTLNDPELRDMNDAASAVPPQAYSIVELDPGEGSTLRNQRVEITSLSDPSPEHADPAGELLFDRSQPQFEEVMAFYHVDSSLAYVESLGFTGTSQAVAHTVLVDAHGSGGADNSFYSKKTSGEPTLNFGDGGVDDAEDPDIILHELGHVLHDGLAPSALTGGPTSESRALSEGFSDYWAFTQGWRASVASGRDPYCIGDWDARCGPASSRCSYGANSDCLRRIDSQVTMREFQRSGGSGTEHRNGTIWSSALREIFLSLVEILGPEEGRRVSDRMVLEGLAGLPFRAGFSDAANRLIEVDAALNGGSARDLICGAMRPRGVDLETCGNDFDGRFTYVPRSAGAVAVPSGTIWRSEKFVPVEGTVSSVRVRVVLDQPAAGSVVLRLVSPNGRAVSLTRSGGWRGPVDGTFGMNIPSFEPLSWLSGQPASGFWYLEVETFGGEVTLRDWSLGVSVEDAELVTRSSAGSITALIPAVASTQGALGTRYVSDLTLFNHTSAGHRVHLVYTPSVDPAGERVVSVTVGPSRTVTIPDIVRTMFDSSGIGALEVRGGRGAIRATSRTYNNSPEGTFGQSIGPYRSPVAGSGRFVYIPGLRETTEYRSNLGLFEASGSPAEVEVVLLDGSGEVIGQTSISLEPWKHVQMPVGAISGAEGFALGTTQIRVTGGGGLVAAYGSVIDNRTGDSIYIPADGALESSMRFTIPVVAHLDGGSGTRWRSDVVIFNPNGESREASMIFRSSQGGSELIERMSLSAGQSVLIEDVLLSIFGVENGSGQLMLEKGGVLIFTRTWNDHPAGTFGQFIGPLPLEESVSSAHDRGYAAGAIISDAYRTNVGMTESSGKFGVFAVSLLDGTGVEICRQQVGLGPWEGWQSDLRSFGCGRLASGTVRIEHVSGEGHVFGYISVVDNATGDPTYVPVSAGPGN